MILIRVFWICYEYRACGENLPNVYLMDTRLSGNLAEGKETFGRCVLF